MRVLVTGVDGFIGRNLFQHLSELKGVEIVPFGRGQSLANLPAMVEGVDFVFHLAGVNRSTDPLDFQTGNSVLTNAVAEAVGLQARENGRIIPLLVAGSTQAATDSIYGMSKRNAEDAARKVAEFAGFPLYLFRLPNVFGKWARPNYNSVVATFCHNIALGLPIELHDPEAMLTLVYIDDVIAEFVKVMNGSPPSLDEMGFAVVQPQHRISVGGLAVELAKLHEDRNMQRTGKVGSGLQRALYATYMSYLPVESAAYYLKRHEDLRGTFVEILKTPESGQFSYFTAPPGVTRGGHYHHSKVEKFLVVRGRATIRFQHIKTGLCYEKVLDSSVSEVVETIPGWAHDITNIGMDELIVFLWANEVFDPTKPDTFQFAL